jgi:RNA polymerase sigma-70 factor (ECF subfamily)
MEECIPTPDDEGCRVDDKALGEALNRFLASLDLQKRNIFVRRYWYMDSVSDISRRYSVSESKVKTTLFRCRNKLREFLEKEGYTI